MDICHNNILPYMQHTVYDNIATDIGTYMSYITFPYGTLLNSANMINKVIGNSVFGAEWDGMIWGGSCSYCSPVNTSTENRWGHWDFWFICKPLLDPWSSFPSWAVQESITSLTLKLLCCAHITKAQCKSYHKSDANSFTYYIEKVSVCYIETLK